MINIMDGSDCNTIIMHNQSYTKVKDCDAMEAVTDLFFHILMYTLL